MLHVLVVSLAACFAKLTGLAVCQTWSCALLTGMLSMHEATARVTRFFVALLPSVPMHWTAAVREELKLLMTDL